MSFLLGEKNCMDDGGGQCFDRTRPSRSHFERENDEPELVDEDSLLNFRYQSNFVHFLGTSIVT